MNSSNFHHWSLQIPLNLRKSSQSHKSSGVSGTSALLPTTSIQSFLYGSLNLKNCGYWLLVSTAHIISPLAVLHIRITNGRLGLKYDAHSPVLESYKLSLFINHSNVVFTSRNEEVWLSKVL